MSIYQHIMSERLLEERSESYPSPENIAFAAQLELAMRRVEAQGDYTLDVHQISALEAIAHAVLDGNTTGYVEMATSTGKTVIESLVVAAAAKAGKRVLILAPTLSIAEQLDGRKTRSTGLARFTDLLKDPSQVRRHFGTNRGNKSAQIVVSTYSGFVNDLDRGSNTLGDFDIIVADECHHSLGPKTSAALDSAYPGAIKLGFTATPDYATNRKSDMVYGKSLFEFSITEAIESGRTSAVRALVIETDQPLKLTAPGERITEQELAALIYNSERNGIAFQMAHDLVADGRQGIIACIPGEQNLHAQLLAQLLNNPQPDGTTIKASDVGSHLSNDEQALRLAAFQRGEIDVLTFTRTIAEGWDSKNASFCLSMQPTASEVLKKQLLGRILRRNPDSRESIFVDFVDKLTGLPKHVYTALHALGIEEVDFNRVLHRTEPHDNEAPYVPTRFVLPSFSENIMKRLMGFRGKLVDDVLKRQRDNISPEDALYAKWEKILASEGMPAELPANIALTPELSARYDAAVQTAGLEPNASQREIIETLNEARFPKRLIKFLGIYASQVDADLDPIDTDSRHDPKEVSRVSRIGRAVRSVLETLDERTIDVLNTYYSDESDGTQITEQLAAKYGLSRQRIHQIRRIGLSRLQQPFRSAYLKAQAGVNIDALDGILSDGPPPLPTTKRQQLDQFRVHALRPITTDEQSSIFGYKPINFDRYKQSYFEALSIAANYPEAELWRAIGHRYEQLVDLTNETNYRIRTIYTDIAKVIRDKIGDEDMLMIGYFAFKVDLTEDTECLMVAKKIMEDFDDHHKLHGTLEPLYSQIDELQLEIARYRRLIHIASVMDMEYPRPISDN